MRVLITGGRGFIGSELTRTLLARGLGAETLEEIVALDIAPAPASADPRVRHVVADSTDPAILARTFKSRFGLVFALSATLTQEAEQDFERGLDVNVQGFLRLLSACRKQGESTRVVFTSSIAAFGGALPETVEDDWPRTPQTSYGTHKAIVELLLADATRRGFIDGRALRLPIVVTRPGPPVPSISDRVAALIREPLRGHDVICPLIAETCVPLASVQSVARALVDVAALPHAALGATRAINLPSLSARVGDLVESVCTIARRRKWARPVGRVTWTPDASMQAIVAQWPRRFESARARSLGIGGSATLEALIDDFVDHDARP